MTRALITGITGCVGSNLATALRQRGVEVVGLRYNGAPMVNLDGLDIELVEGNILDPASLRPAIQGADWVFHVAGIADDWRYPAELVYRTNVEGTRNMLAAALEAGVQRFVYTSSSAALGLPTRRTPILDETCTFNIKPQRWIYGHSKVLAEEAVQTAVKQGLQAVIVQPTAIMGPGDITFICGQLVTRALKHELFPLPSGGGNFIDVRDVALAQIAAAERGRAGERYLLGGDNMSHAEMCRRMSRALGMRVLYVRVPQLGLPVFASIIRLLQRLGLAMPMDGNRVRISGWRMYYDISKAARELRLQPRPFEETVRATYLWYREHHFLEPLGIHEDAPFVRECA